ncbi:MAG: PASTA domain-containing protein, partial [Ardenticatenaceae bacterium]
SLSQALTQALTAPEPQVVSSPPPIVEERIERVTVQRPRWIPLALLMGFAITCLLLTLLFQSTRNSAGAVVPPTATPDTVPNLVGPPPLRYNEAVALAWNRGYRVSIIGFVEGPDIPPGVVVTQCPLAGSPPGTVINCPTVGSPPAENTILVEVSSLPELVVLRVVPDLYGQPEPAARAALEAGGLRLGTLREAYDLLMPSGRIVEQNPRRGLGVLPGTPVDVIVSAGPPPAAGQTVPPAPQPTFAVVPPVETVIVPVTVVPSPTEPPLLVTPTQAPSVTPLPLATTPATEEASGTTVLLEDDFEEGNQLGWVVADAEGQDSAIGDGLFEVAVTEPGLFWKSQPGRLFADFTYEAEVTLGEDSIDEEGGAGLAFRIQDDEHFYFFQINGAGAYRLLARSEDSWLTLLDWEPVPALQPVGSTNLLSVTAEGERLTLAINGEQVAVHDTPGEASYANGDIGLAVQSDILPITAAFDNVLVTR